jgi:hypothetical protein
VASSCICLWASAELLKPNATSTFSSIFDNIYFLKYRASTNSAARQHSFNCFLVHQLWQQAQRSNGIITKGMKRKAKDDWFMEEATTSKLVKQFPTDTRLARLTELKNVDKKVLRAMTLWRLGKLPGANLPCWRCGTWGSRGHLLRCYATDPRFRRTFEEGANINETPTPIDTALNSIAVDSPEADHQQLFDQLEEILLEMMRRIGEFRSRNRYEIRNEEEVVIAQQALT